jgi:hypothetical protein
VSPGPKNNFCSIFLNCKIFLGSEASRIAQEIVTTLSNLINTSFVEGKFPENIKRSDVRPVFKNKGEETDVANYRPISMTSTVRGKNN